MISSVLVNKYAEYLFSTSKDRYSHILDENRKVNARLIEDAIYQKESAEIHLKAEVKENEPQVNQSDADAAEAMKKLATNPELMQLLIKLSKSM